MKSSTIKRAKPVRLAVYDACDDDGRKSFVGRVYDANNPEDASIMRDIIREYNAATADRDTGPMVMAAFPYRKR